jgi:cell division protein FtsB
MARLPRSAFSAPAEDGAGVGAWFRNLQLSGFTVTVFLLIVAALVVLAPSLRIAVEQQQEITELERLVAEQQAAVEDLEIEIDRWQDPAYIEAQARGRLLYVYPGDISYLVIDDGPMAESDNGQPISDEIQTTRIQWTRALLSSFVTAGLTDLPADALVSPEFGGVR